MDWAKIARDAYLAIGREYGATRRRPMPMADFADFGPRALDVGAGSGAQQAYLEHEHPYVVHCDLDRGLMPPRRLRGARSHHVAIQRRRL